MSLSTAVINSVLFAFLGIAILVIIFTIVELLTPKHNIRREILEKQNMALAVLASAFMLSMAIIIASAIH
jgi:putative membrane protein